MSHDPIKNRMTSKARKAGGFFGDNAFYAGEKVRQQQGLARARVFFIDLITFLYNLFDKRCGVSAKVIGMTMSASKEEQVVMVMLSATSPRAK